MVVFKSKLMVDFGYRYPKTDEMRKDEQGEKGGARSSLPCTGPPIHWGLNFNHMRMYQQKTGILWEEPLVLVPKWGVALLMAGNAVYSHGAATRKAISDNRR